MSCLRLHPDFLLRANPVCHQGPRPKVPAEQIAAEAVRVAQEEPLFAIEDHFKRRTDATGFTTCVRCKRRMSENMRALCGRCRKVE